jgi:hypothetical protein
VIKAQDAQTTQYYVVLKDKVAAITPFVAGLVRAAWSQDESADIKLSTPQVIDANGGNAQPFYKDKGWFETVPKQANSPASATAEARTTSCSVYDGTIGQGNKPQLAAWAGTAYPKRIVADSLSAYVSSGSGLLFTEITGAAAGGGAQYLLTDTGLRYSLPRSNDSAAQGSDSSSGASDSSNGDASETDKARTRLGYEDVSRPAIVPQTWAAFIPTGPTLDTGSAAQEQSQ